MKRIKTRRHVMADLSGSNTSTLKKARRLANIDAGNRPRSGRIVQGAFYLHATKGWRPL